jgi:HAD superfamily hydrolase (TIGR01509 family)
MISYIFDFGGTLAETVKPTPKIIEGFQRVISSTLDIPLQKVKIVEALMNKNESQLFDYKARVGMNTLAAEKNAHVKWFSKMLNYLNIDPASYPGLIEKLCKMNMTGIQYYLYKDTIPCLKQIRKNGDRIYILSNGLPSKRAEIGKIGLNRFVDKIYVSSELGFEKPSPKIYKLVLNDLQIETQRAVFIDNQIDCVEAADLLHIKSFRIVRGRGIPRSKWDISSLSEIFKAS